MLTCVVRWARAGQGQLDAPAWLRGYVCTLLRHAVTAAAPRISYIVYRIFRVLLLDVLTQPETVWEHDDSERAYPS